MRISSGDKPVISTTNVPVQRTAKMLRNKKNKDLHKTAPSEQDGAVTIAAICGSHRRQFSFRRYRQVESESHLDRCGSPQSAQ